MLLQVRKMTEKYATEVLCWKYDKPYDFYNQILSSGAIMELLTYKYYVVLDDYLKVIGFFCTGKPARVPLGEKFYIYEEDCVDIGIGLKPELTGKGNGKTFLTFILRFLEESDSRDIRLTVATFNKRAIKLYENVGFKEQIRFYKNDTEFMTMIKRKDGMIGG
ncbi:GNAT family N-acetyltransferase [Oceanobacillus piezotolerans]|uniref:GNAT family N-acetyltransferase n=1 Tax=Oceanobacillus piezotolerans TaxID=2448030 RepID=A0A498D625_9BACI|nr:GNAT family N-acetyltransferase [Oceanobacillus piezotolerans]RLL44906.1 GNAT family N-acetyltransferase [Oceanobacillus piezotolerans]